MLFKHHKSGAPVHMSQRCIKELSTDTQITPNHIQSVIDLIDDIHAIDTTLVVTGIDSTSMFKSICVETPMIDINTNATFAKRPFSTGPSRVLSLKEHDPVETNKITVIIRKNQFVLQPFMIIGYYAGDQAPAEPWNRASINPTGPALKFSTDSCDLSIDKHSVDFWCSHALLVNPDECHLYTSSWSTIIKNFYSDNPNYF